MLVFCSLCVSDEYTTDGVTEDGRRFVVCSNTREHGADGYVWEPTEEKKGRSRGDGLGAELDIWDKLLECITADGEATPTARSRTASSSGTPTMPRCSRSGTGTVGGRETRRPTSSRCSPISPVVCETSRGRRRCNCRGPGRRPLGVQRNHQLPGSRRLRPGRRLARRCLRSGRAVRLVRE